MISRRRPSSPVRVGFLLAPALARTGTADRPVALAAAPLGLLPAPLADFLQVFCDVVVHRPSLPPPRLAGWKQGQGSGNLQSVHHAVGILVDDVDDFIALSVEHDPAGIVFKNHRHRIRVDGNPPPVWISISSWNRLSMSFIFISPPFIVLLRSVPVFYLDAVRGQRQYARPILPPRAFFRLRG